MENEYYFNNIKLLDNISSEVNNNNISLLQHLLLLASALLGLLAGLNPDLEDSKILQIFFIATIILFVLTILCGIFALYGFQVVRANSKYEKFKEELLKAIQEKRKMENVMKNVPQRYFFSMRLCLIFFGLSLLFISVYSIIAVIN